jgi:hypothetical protein
MNKYQVNIAVPDFQIEVEALNELEANEKAWQALSDDEAYSVFINRVWIADCVEVE